MRKPLAASESPKDSNLKRDKGRDRELVGNILAGKYKILKILGQGGFGSVFLVEMTSGIIGDRLAMKILPGEFSQNNMLREQFMNEIRVAMKMVDAHIVQIRDVGITEGDPDKGGGLLYYTMDYVNGKTLGQLIKQEGTLSIWRALRIARRLLPALKVAHGAGIIHRDLKPANIMIEVVGEKELPRILDFGIATAVIADTELENSLEGGLKDKKGFVGSPYYMPPEQFQGVEMGFYTDLYSLGVIIYECLTGQKPYTGKTPKEVYKKIKQGAPVPVDELQPAVGKVPGLAELVMKSLERNPEKRFQSAKEFYEALNGVMSGKNEETAPAAAPAAVKPPKSPPMKPRLAARQRAAGMRKTGMGAAIRDRLPQRRGSSLGTIAMLILGLGTIGLLAFLFKDEILEEINKQQQESPEAPTGTSRKTPETEKPGPDAGAKNTGLAEKKKPEEKKPPQGQPPPQEKPEPSTSERMEAIREQLAERVELHLKEGESALFRKEWDTANHAADSILEIEAFHAGALLLKARVMLNTNKNISAIVTLESALKTVNENALRIDILRYLAIAHTSLQKPDWKLAAKKLEEATALDLKNGLAARMLVDAYKKLEKDKALAAFVKRAYEAENKDRVISELYKQIWVLEPQRRQKEFEEQTALALKAYSQEDYATASKAASRTFAIQLPGEPNIEVAEIAVDSFIRRAADFPQAPGRSPGHLSRFTRDARKALSRLYGFVKDALEAGEDDAMTAKVIFYDAKITYLETRNDRKSEDYLEGAGLKFANLLNRLRGKKPTEMYYEARTWRGLVCASRGDFDGVVKEFDEARDSRNPGLMEQHAITYLAMGHYLKQSDNRKKAYGLARGRLLNLLKVAKLPESKKAGAYYKLGSCYLRMGILTSDDGDLRKAANRFMEAKKLGLDNARLFENLGETYRHLGEFIKAAVYYRDAYYKDPSPSRCLMAVSHFLESNPRAPQAKDLLLHALQKFPDNEDLLKKQQALE